MTVAFTDHIIYYFDISLIPPRNFTATPQRHLREAFLMTNQNICFSRIKKKICGLLTKLM